MQAHARPRLVASLLTAVVSIGLLTPATGQDHQRAQVPGEVDARVTQATIRSTICTRGYGAKVRPPRKVTDAIKRRLAQGLPAAPTDYELDHLIPIGLGGHPSEMLHTWDHS